MGVWELVAVSCLYAKEYYKQMQKLFIPLVVLLSTLKGYRFCSQKSGFY